MLSQNIPYLLETLGRILRRRSEIAPHRRGPAEIVFPSADDVQMHLPHDVANAGEVNLSTARFLLNKPGHQRRFLHRHASQFLRQIEQIADLRFRNQDKPGNRCVLVQQDMAEFEFADAMTVGKQLAMNLEVWHGDADRLGSGLVLEKQEHRFRSRAPVYLTKEQQ